MKCSLLTLSTYVDSEMDARQRAELEAHLVGCGRCSAGLEHLREEMTRVGGLARVRIPDHSAGDLLEQLDLIAPGEHLPMRTNATVTVEREENDRPWMRGLSASPPVASALGMVPSMAPRASERATTVPSPGAPERGPTDAAEESGDSSVELSGTASTSAEPETAAMSENSGGDVVTEPGTPETTPETTPDDEVATVHRAWTSAASWAQPEAAASQVGWYPPVPPTPRPGPTPIEPPQPPVAGATEAAATEAAGDEVSEITDTPAAPPAAEIAYTGSGASAPPGVPPTHDVEPQEGPPMPLPTYTPSRIDDVDDLGALAESHAATEEVDDSEIFAAPPRRASRGGTGIGLIDRVLDRIAVMRALHGRGNGYDDSVEIVSGTGAPLMSSSTRAQVQQQRVRGMHAAADVVVPAAEEVVETPIGETSFPEPPLHDEPPVTGPAVTDIAPPMAAASAPAWREHLDFEAPQHSYPLHRDDDVEIEGHAAPAEPETVSPPEIESGMAAAAPLAYHDWDEVDDEEPIRALRRDAIRRHGLDQPERAKPASRGNGVVPAVTGALASGAAIVLGASRAGVDAVRRGATSGISATPIGRFDLRARLALAAVAVMLVAGLALGKTSAPISSTTTSSPSTAITNGTPAPAVSTQPVAKAPAPAASAPAAPPAPAQSPTALTLTNPVQFGGSATGVTVNNVRYGVHPGDFRIVFDMSGPGAPQTVTGMLDGNTLVVIMKGTTAPASFTPPPSSTVVTSVTTMPSATAGETIIKITLAHSVTVAHDYLSGPLRLVLDLT